MCTMLLARRHAASQSVTGLCDDTRRRSFASSIGAARRPARRPSLPVSQLNPVDWITDSVA